jgi:hypothetical protein
LQWDIFKDLGALDSSSRFFEEGGSAYPAQEHTSIAEDKIGMLRDNKNAHVKNIMRNNVPLLDANRLEESSAPRSLKISHCKISCCI